MAAARPKRRSFESQESIADNRFALHSAATAGRADELEKLLQSSKDRANLNRPDDDGYTPLHLVGPVFLLFWGARGESVG